MKTSRRMLAVVVCMVMVLSMAVVASAAASKLFSIRVLVGISVLAVVPLMEMWQQQRLVQLKFP